MKKLVLLIATVLLSGAFGLLSTLNAQILSEHTIGPGDLQDRIPMDFYWRNSLYQCIFTLDDLEGAAGYIEAIAFYSNFNNPNLPPETDISLYLAASTQSDLASAWIPASQMTLVFQGSLDLFNGQKQIRVDLAQSFLLPLNRHLVMMVERGFQASYYVAVLPFFAQECSPANARKTISDTDDLDPFNPPTPARGARHRPESTAPDRRGSERTRLGVRPLGLRCLLARTRCTHRCALRRTPEGVRLRCG